MTKPNSLDQLCRLSPEYSNKADLRLHLWYLVACLAFVGGSFLLLSHPEWPKSLRIATELIPMLPAFLFLRDMARFVRGMDELQRRIQLEAAAVGAFAMLFAIWVVNVLNANGVYLPGSIRGLGSAYFLIFTYTAWRISAFIVSRSYR